MNNNLDFNELDKDIQVVLLLVDNPAFNVEKPYELEMCGLSMKNWVKSACKNAIIYEKEISSDGDIISTVKDVNLGDRKYTFVLFSDTPLLKRKTILEIIEYVQMKKLSVLKLTRGYIFETSYLKTIDKLYAPQLHYFDEEDFITCFNFKQFALINDILQTRIINYHMKNGVQFIKPETSEIDVNVVIGKGAIVGKNNKIKGKCIIENNSQIYNDNTIINSVIKSGAIVEKSVINNSFIEEECIIKPYCVIENNSLLQNNCFIESFCHISKSVVKSEEKVKSFSKIIN